MKKYTVKTLLRSVRASFGRYAAILAIIALSVGFFTGLKNATPAMRRTADRYLTEQAVHDFELLSTIGFTEEDVVALKELPGVAFAEGGYLTDASARVGSDREAVFRLYSLPEHVSLPRLAAGRMPENAGECLADAALFGEEAIGETLTLSAENASLTGRTFTVVGLVTSPRFLGQDRGTSSLGDGRVAGFFYLPAEAFSDSIYHEIHLRGDFSKSYFSTAYEKERDSLRPALEELVNDRLEERYRRLTEEGNAAIASAEESLRQGWEAYRQAEAAGTLSAEQLASLKNELTAGEEALAAAKKELEELPAPALFLLDLDSNAGFVSFQNDIGIVSGIADAFPIFFVLVAALVSLTTMARMVNEERTQIGTLKAMGYTNTAISWKYTLYAGSASLIGCAVGFFLGTGVIPEIVWSVYSSTYRFSSLAFYFSPLLYISCLLITAAGSVGVTLLTCRRELREKPAELIRPKTPAKGKRIFLEKIRFFWNRLSFLNKVTLRNAFRSKKRMAMMLIGTAGCTALLVAGFGMKDSIRGLLTTQYEEIALYDGYLSYDGEADTEDRLTSFFADKGADFAFAHREETQIQANGGVRTAIAVALPSDRANEFVSLHRGKETLSYPKAGEAAVSSQLADRLSLKLGDTLKLSLDEKVISLTVTAIFDNHIDHYVYLSDEALPVARNAAYFNSKDPAGLAAPLRQVNGVSQVSLVSEERALLEESMANMNYIVLLILVAAGALAFIVLHNLTNINIMERIREVATVKVLGFDSRETASYVMRENLILAALGGGIGLLLGKLLHVYILSQIKVDKIVFDFTIAWWSFLLSFACTLTFALISNLFMRIKLSRINMAESLKAVE